MAPNVHMPYTLDVDPCKVCSCLPKQSMGLNESFFSHILLILAVSTCQHPWGWLPSPQGYFTHSKVASHLSMSSSCLLTRRLMGTPRSPSAPFCFATASSLLSLLSACLLVMHSIFTRPSPYKEGEIHIPPTLLEKPRHKKKKKKKRNQGTGKADDFLESQKVIKNKIHSQVVWL